MIPLVIDNAPSGSFTSVGSDGGFFSYLFYVAPFYEFTHMLRDSLLCTDMRRARVLWFTQNMAVW